MLISSICSNQLMAVMLIVLLSGALIMSVDGFVSPLLLCDLVLVWNCILAVHGIMSSDMSGKVLLVMQVLKPN